MKPMTNDEFIGYCRIHCKTERALFNADDVTRIYGLAGLPTPVIGMFKWLSMHGEMEALFGGAGRYTLRLWDERAA